MLPRSSFVAVIVLCRDYLHMKVVTRASFVLRYNVAYCYESGRSACNRFGVGDKYRSRLKQEHEVIDAQPTEVSYTSNQRIKQTLQLQRN